MSDKNNHALKIIFGNGRSLIFICMIFGFLLTVAVRHGQDLKINLPTENFAEVEQKNLSATVQDISDDLKILSCTVGLEGSGVVVKIDDSKRAVQIGENQNLYVIHDDDILRIVNELRAAGAEAISINGQRLTATSEIRCAGPTLSVNNIRSAAPFEISAIGDKKNLENSIKMRGGVADSLKVWGIEIEVTPSDKISIPPYTGTVSRTYAKIVE